ncbi:MAG TPA: PLP-dependent aspartate aminotransferase family protein [Longimicrobiales bacterium]|nr:PLP-dependent aspartate aminotransferase family protein [Longimicrobiales bacterium]
MAREKQAATRGISTKAVHGASARPKAGEPLSTPILQSSTFINDIVPDGDVLYTRYGNNPTQEALARRLAALEGAEAAVAVGSGMAAMSLALLAFLNAGDHVVAAQGLYGGTLKLLTSDLPRLGIDTTFVPHGGRWARAMQRKTTRVVVLETLSNPTLRLTDIRPIANAAKERGVAVIVDNTFATPALFRPLEHGADVVIHSATKYLGGHSDVTAGVVAGQIAVIEEVIQKLRSFGPAIDPHLAWLLERGVKTLALRVERQCRNALALARALDGRKGVRTVIYPGLESHPDHALARELLPAFGGMLSLVVEGGDKRAEAVMRRFRLIYVAPSLGSVESLASMPRHTSHKHLSDAERAAIGIEPGFIRISVGIEDEADLLADLEHALDA